MKKTLFLFILFSVISFSTSLSAQQTMVQTSSNSRKLDETLLIAYPNPTKDFLVLKSKNPELKIKSLTFYSILGVQVAQFNLNMSQAQVNLDRLKPGKYLMKYVMSDDKQMVTQIIKQ